jgi:hypothetical protein
VKVSETGTASSVEGPRIRRISNGRSKAEDAMLDAPGSQSDGRLRPGLFKLDWRTRWILLDARLHSGETEKE